MSRIGHYRPMPEDFPEHAHEKNVALMKHYHVGWDVLIRWKDLCGTSKPWGRAVIRIDADGNTERFQNVKAAALTVFGGNGSNIYRAIRYGGKAYGYHWRYADEDP